MKIFTAHLSALAGKLVTLEKQPRYSEGSAYPTLYREEKPDTEAQEARLQQTSIRR